MKVTFANGETIRVSQREYWNRRSAFQARFDPQAFMRIGDYHLAIGTDLASYFEPTPKIPVAWLEKWEHPEYQISFGRDRLSQCADIEAALKLFPNHPHAPAIRAAIEAERAGWSELFAAKKS